MGQGKRLFGKRSQGTGPLAAGKPGTSRRESWLCQDCLWHQRPGPLQPKGTGHLLLQQDRPGYYPGRGRISNILPAREDWRAGK